MKIIIIDNNDSFTANLQHLLAMKTNSTPEIVPYAEIRDVKVGNYDLIVISPGPGQPSDYPDYGQLLDQNVPVLGICLGMQLINEHFGGETSPLKDCIHGQTDRIEFEGREFSVARYHSLYMSHVPDCFDILAVNADKVPMAIKHKTRPLLGYQFHPESFMTDEGGLFIDYALRTLNIA